MEQNNFSSPPLKPIDGHFLKFFVGFILILAVVFGGWLVYDKYFSASARSARETQQNYEKYLNWEKQYNEAMTADTYGGKTPQETLNMFIEALKKEDVDLASKYFSLDTNEQEYNIENYLTRNKTDAALKKAGEEGRLSEIIDIVSRAKLDKEAGISEKSAWFISYNKNNLKEIVADIHLILNDFSNVWKIESL